MRTRQNFKKPDGGIETQPVVAMTAVLVWVRTLRSPMVGLKPHLRPLPPICSESQNFKKPDGGIETMY